MDTYRLRSWIKQQTQHLGVDILRYPSPRLLGGQTAILLRDLGIQRVLDVGANIGQYGRFLRSLGYRGDIVSFEPVARSYAELATRSARDPRWTAVPIALGSENGRAFINKQEDSCFNSFRTSLGASDGDQCGREEVEVRTLDSVFEEYTEHRNTGHIFLKMDTQGWDLEVLRGARGCLPAVVAVQSEIAVTPIYRGMPSWLESLNYLGAAGFEPTGMFPVTYCGSNLRAIEFDILMVRPEGYSVRLRESCGLLPGTG